jgi:dihydrofolate reductase
LEVAYDLGENEVFIAGGAQIYNQTIEYWDRLYITEIDAEYEGDVFFPEIDLEKWDLKSKKVLPISDKNIHELSFKVYDRKYKK